MSDRFAFHGVACVLIAAAIGLSSATPSHAQEQSAAPEQSAAAPPVTERARAHFNKGIDYYADGDLTSAMVELQRAYRLQPVYRLLYNLGQVSYEQRDYAAAERYFGEYLEQGGDEIPAARRQEVEADLERLKGRVADLRLTSNLPGAKFFVDDRAVGSAPLPGPLRISAGRRQLRAESPGHAPVTRTVDVVGGDSLAFQLSFADALAPKPEPDRTETGTRAALWTAVATGVVGLGAGTMALLAHSDDNAYQRALERRTSRAELDSLADRTKEKALVTDILLGATVILGATTLVLLLTERRHEERPPAKAPAVTLGLGSVRASF
jgi:tetratricopeptide (TPR) repeat protein